MLNKLTVILYNINEYGSIYRIRNNFRIEFMLETKQYSLEERLYALSIEVLSHKVFGGSYTHNMFLS